MFFHPIDRVCNNTDRFRNPARSTRIRVIRYACNPINLSKTRRLKYLNSFFRTERTRTIYWRFSWLCTYRCIGNRFQKNFVVRVHCTTRVFLRSRVEIYKIGYCHVQACDMPDESQYRRFYTTGLQTFYRTDWLLTIIEFFFLFFWYTIWIIRILTIYCNKTIYCNTVV